MTILMLESEWESSYSLIVIEDVVDFIRDFIQGQEKKKAHRVSLHGSRAKNRVIF